MTIQELRKHFYHGKANAYASGGDPMFFVCSDGGVLCPDCVTKERGRILRATHEQDCSGWAIAGVDINWDDTELFCDHCSKRIESAYGKY